ncbi:MAG TPA: flagellin [Solirubrobacteraceae bacterium]|jgi:flagellin|nr:flagellin [Solirubrobacteraceae bacterium]
MSLSILTNVAAMQTQQNLLNSSNAVATSMQRLSSGLRINSAADDAAGYAISEGLTSQVNGLNQASSNTADAVSMVQTASSSVNNVQSMLQRIYELGVQYNNGTNSSTDKSDIQAEVNQLTQEIDRQRTSSNFNGINLLNGSAGGSGTVTFQVGANSGDNLSATFSDIEGTGGLGGLGFSWSNASGGSTVVDLSNANALTSLTNAINNMSSVAATLGAVQNRLQYTSDAISSTEQNLTSTNSQIKDVNMAQEMTTLTQQQILEQAGTSMLAQANSQPQLILKLLG